MTILGVIWKIGGISMNYIDKIKSKIMSLAVFPTKIRKMEVWIVSYEVQCWCFK